MSDSPWPPPAGAAPDEPWGADAPDPAPSPPSEQLASPQDPPPVGAVPAGAAGAPAGPGGPALPPRPFEEPQAPDVPQPRLPSAEAPAAGPKPAGIGSKILFWGGLLLMIGASVTLVGDWAARNYETARLLDAIEASEEQMRLAQDDILAVDVPAEPTAEQAQEVEAELREIAAAGRRGVAEAGATVGQVQFLPWHADLLSAQAAYLAHNRAWEDYLTAGAEEPKSLYGDDNQIEPTWRRAEFEVREAVPPLPWPGVSDRVEAIFTDEEPTAPGKDVAA